jgi:hypothetical protein
MKRAGCAVEKLSIRVEIQCNVPMNKHHCELLRFTQGSYPTHAKKRVSV